MLGLLDLLVRQEMSARLVRQESRVILAPRVLQAQLGRKETSARLVPQGRLVRQVHKAIWDLRVLLVRLVVLVRLDLLERQDRLTEMRL